MDHFRYYCSEDFVWDDLFRAWVLTPTAENKRVWSQWLRDHPEKSFTVRVAREAILALQCEEPRLTDRDMKERVKEILDQIP